MTSDRIPAGAGKLIRRILWWLECRGSGSRTPYSGGQER